MQVTITKAFGYHTVEAVSSDYESDGLIEAQVIHKVGNDVKMGGITLLPEHISQPKFNRYEKAVLGALYQFVTKSKKELDFCQSCGYVDSHLVKCFSCGESKYFGTVIIDEKEVV